MVGDVCEATTGELSFDFSGSSYCRGTGALVELFDGET